MNGVNQEKKAYNLSHAVNFTTRIQINPSIAIVNIFVDNSRINLSFTSPTIYGILDDDAQILAIKYICTNK